MGKIKMLQPRRLGTLQTKVRPATTVHASGRPRLAGRPWRRMRTEVLRANPLCVECEKVGRVSLAVECDHEVALINGGSDDISNLRGLCKECHDAKTARDLAEFARGGRP